MGRAQIYTTAHRLPRLGWVVLFDVGKPLARGYFKDTHKVKGEKGGMR